MEVRGPNSLTQAPHKTTLLSLPLPSYRQLPAGELRGRGYFFSWNHSQRPHSQSSFPRRIRSASPGTIHFAASQSKQEIPQRLSHRAKNVLTLKSCAWPEGTLAQMRCECVSRLLQFNSSTSSAGCSVQGAGCSVQQAGQGMLGYLPSPTCTCTSMWHRQRPAHTCTCTCTCIYTHIQTSIPVMESVFLPDIGTTTEIVCCAHTLTHLSLHLH